LIARSPELFRQVELVERLPRGRRSKTDRDLTKKHRKPLEHPSWISCHSSRVKVQPPAGDIVSSEPWLAAAGV
jgi:hypothetical protein